MNNVELEHPSLHQSNELNLLLMDRPVHPELFHHYAEFRAGQARYRADIWITGLGHVVTVSAGDLSLSELVAAESESLPSHGVVTRFRMKGERDLDRKTSEGWNYMVSSQIEMMDEALYKSVHDDLMLHATTRGWFHSYDFVDGPVTPFTYIEAEARADEFHVHAFHAFPSECAIVKTQSIFELPE